MLLCHSRQTRLVWISEYNSCFRSNDTSNRSECYSFLFLLYIGFCSSLLWLLKFYCNNFYWCLKLDIGFTLQVWKWVFVSYFTVFLALSSVKLNVFVEKQHNFSWHYILCLRWVAQTIWFFVSVSEVFWRSPEEREPGPPDGLDWGWGVAFDTPGQHAPTLPRLHARTFTERWHRAIRQQIAGFVNKSIAFVISDFILVSTHFIPIILNFC